VTDRAHAERVGLVLMETYRLERLIAEGGMASVWEASHLRIPKRFAIKFLKLSLVNNTEALQRFRREAEIIATLDHPHIVQLIDYNVLPDGVPYIVLEFLPGESLAARIVRGPIELTAAARILERVGDGLATAHARGVIHRDLKPENIILNNGDGVKVVDFGVAKLRGGTDLTAVNTVVGTVCYMAPEQLTGSAVGPAADQWALAMIAREMLTGEMFVNHELPLTEQAMRVLYGTPTPLGPAFPPALEEILRRAAAKRPEERFETLSDFIEAFTRAATGTVISEDRAVTPEDGLPALLGEVTAITSAPMALGALSTSVLPRSAVVPHAADQDDLEADGSAPRNTLKTMPTVSPEQVVEAPEAANGNGHAALPPGATLQRPAAPMPLPGPDDTAKRRLPGMLGSIPPWALVGGGAAFGCVLMLILWAALGRG
jgi:serine/threonine protein kinase